MSAFFYYLGTAADSVLGVFGIRTPYEQPPYRVIGTLADGVEIRAYGSRVAVETAMRSGNDGEAFGRLFRYITGANKADTRIAMTVPVEEATVSGKDAKPPPSTRIAMTVPVEMSGGEAMRFFLPRTVVAAGPPVPTDPLVHLVTLPPETFAVLRFSGSIDEATRAAQQSRLLSAVSGGGRHAIGVPSMLSYDPPFALPFLRRNEVAVRLDAVPEEQNRPAAGSSARSGGSG